MKQIEYFVPGDQEVDTGVLSRLRWPIPAGVADAYVEACSAPGELVLVPYCQGPTVIRAVLAAKRRIVALNFDPVVVKVVQATLDPLPTLQLNAAVAQLGDSLKQGIPLRRRLEDLYATTCPACMRPAIAHHFIWDRDQNAPVTKGLRCVACAWDGQAAAELEDRARAADMPERGMHYHYVLDRVTSGPQRHLPRARLERLLQSYTPRSLYALAELTLRIESLFPTEPVRRALQVLLLDCLDRCSPLNPMPDGRVRQPRLSRPGRFMELNVWHAFEEAASRFPPQAASPVPRLADSLESYQASPEQWAGLLCQGLVRDLPRALPPRSVRLILTSPPPLDLTSWTLSFFWGAWLLGAEAVAPLWPLLRQRRPDPAWYARVMADSLRNMASLLTDDGCLVLILTGQRPAVLESLALAAGRARLGVVALVQSGSDYRLQLTPTFAPPIPVAHPPLKVQVREAAVQAAIDTIQLRGEPVAWRTLHAAIQQRLAVSGLLARMQEAAGTSAFDIVAEEVRDGLDSPLFTCWPGPEGPEELWWLAEAEDMAPPLSDRVESTAHQILQDNLALTSADFARAIHPHFPGPLTPEGALLATCLQSYGREVTPGFWQLRSEDAPGVRQAERRGIIEDLQALGKRLGYRSAPWPPLDVAWFVGDQPQSAFLVRWRAAVSEALALDIRPARPALYLVIPGGRAALVGYKLARNPQWQQALDEEGWRFIKYRHVRQLVAQPDVDEYALETIIGLDPIVEKESVQLSLF